MNPASLSLQSQSKYTQKKPIVSVIKGSDRRVLIARLCIAITQAGYRLSFSGAGIYRSNHFGALYEALSSLRQGLNSCKVKQNATQLLIELTNQQANSHV